MWDPLERCRLFGRGLGPTLCLRDIQHRMLRPLAALVFMSATALRLCRGGPTSRIGQNRATSSRFLMRTLGRNDAARPGPGLREGEQEGEQALDLHRGCVRDIEEVIVAHGEPAREEKA